MALPASYTEATLAAYMATELGQLATALGYSGSAGYQEAVNGALALYGVADVAQATDIAKLRALARLEAWKLAASGAAYDFSADGASFSRSQLMDQINARLRAAELEAASYADLPGYAAAVTGVTYTEDYYADTGSESYPDLEVLEP